MIYEQKTLIFYTHLNFPIVPYFFRLFWTVIFYDFTPEDSWPFWYWWFKFTFDLKVSL